MLPKWFDDWNAKNPTDVYRPAILVGVVGAAVVVAGLLVAYGQPWPTQSLQTGPRGTGMHVPDFVAVAARPDPTVAAYVSPPPVEPVPGEPTAGEAYENAEPLLASLPQSQYDRLVGAMREWTGIPDLLAGEENYQTVVARRMIQMTWLLNDAWSGHTNAYADDGTNAGVNCFTCHRGQPVPAGIWFDPGSTVKVMAGWGGVQNRVTMLSQFTSLPSDALQKYLVEGESIKVHDLESRVEGRASDPDYIAWQHTERTFSLMNYFSNSLGVNCVFCHNSRAFYDPGQVTPQWNNAMLAIQMVLEVNNDYLIPLGEVLPAERLGPLGDAPKIACMTCHKGYQRPMGGFDMISDWPELTAEIVAVGN